MFLSNQDSNSCVKLKRIMLFYASFFHVMTCLTPPLATKQCIIINFQRPMGKRQGHFRKLRTHTPTNYIVLKSEAFACEAYIYSHSLSHSIHSRLHSLLVSSTIPNSSPKSRYGGHSQCSEVSNGVPLSASRRLGRPF